jgi:hypothetical protein
MRWIKLTEPTTPPKPTWVNLDRLAQISVVSGDYDPTYKATRLYTTAVVPALSGGGSSIHYVDVIESPDEIFALAQHSTFLAQRST